MESPTPCSTSRMEAFPAGLRVLVVDDDPTWLKILEKMLRKCSYEVTTCGLARAALDMLRERRDRFDIVISDVNMPDMDGFKLLEHVGLEMDLPVIMMSVDGETSRVMKGVQHGACDYLLKPVRMKELRNIWQHVFRKKIHEIKEVESHDSCEEFQFLKSRFDEFEEMHVFCGGGDVNSTKKRKDVENRDHFDPDFADPSSVKKSRVVWTVDLHQKFVNAVNQIGFDKVGPKKILDLMRVPGLTRENVASHLQKYRLYLSRLQKQSDGMTFGGPFLSNHAPPEDSIVNNFSLQSTVADESSGFSSCKRNHVTSVKTEISGDDQRTAILRTGSPRSPNTTLRSKASTVVPDVGYHVHNASSIPTQNCWNGGIAAIPFTEYQRHDNAVVKTSTERQEESAAYSVPLLEVHEGAQESNFYGVTQEDNKSTDVKGHNLKDGSALSSSSPEDLLCSLEEYGYFDMEILNYNKSDQTNEIQSDFCDDLQLDCEYVFELMKYPAQSCSGLFL